jgi:Transposase DDE domain group 1
VAEGCVSPRSRFFHGYYDGYCYLPLHIFCGRHLLGAKLRRSNIDGAAGAVAEVARIIGQIRARWPRVRILLRADSGFCREDLMAWCEANRVDYVFGLARNPRLTAEIATEMAAAQAVAARTGPPLQGLPLVHLGQVEPRHRQGGVDRGRGQSTLHRHFADSRRDRRQAAV